MYYLESGYAKHTRFRNAVLAALVAHAAVLLSISFDAGKPSAHASQIDVTLALQPTAIAPKDANMIAQADQAGSGDEAQANRVTTANPMPPSPQNAESSARSRSREEAWLEQEVITTRSTSSQSVQSTASEQAQHTASLEGISPEVDRLNRELQSLQAELDQQTRVLSENSRVRRLTATSAKRSVDAAYLLDWRQRLEAVGNKYYPEASVRYGIYGDVRLMVIIRQDGSLEDVQVLSSSGYAVLDEAAIKVVRMAAPYAPFPAELRATTDKLEIVRTWQYLKNQLSSN